MIFGYNFFGTGIEAIFAGIFAAFLAQVVKFVGHLIFKRKLDFTILSTTGGMPSSHTAGVVSLATSCGLIAGFDSLYFAIAAGLSIVVMYDAAGVRRAAGKTAEENAPHGHDTNHSLCTGGGGCGWDSNNPCS